MPNSRKTKQEEVRLLHAREHGQTALRELSTMFQVAEKGLYAHGVLTHRRFTYVVGVLNPLHEQLANLARLGGLPTEIVNVPAGLTGLLQKVRGWAEEEPPKPTTSIFFYASYGTDSDFEPTPSPAHVRGKVADKLEAPESSLGRRLAAVESERDQLRQALGARDAHHLCMVESYEGTVRWVGEDAVVVVFEIGDELVEHRYVRDQFIDSRLPDKGDRLAVHVHVARLPRGEGHQQSIAAGTEGEHELRGRRRVLRGDEKF